MKDTDLLSGSLEDRIFHNSIIASLVQCTGLPSSVSSSGRFQRNVSDSRGGGGGYEGVI